jgi:hypothetical protein
MQKGVGYSLSSDAVENSDRLQRWASTLDKVSMTPTPIKGPVVTIDKVVTR